jgi:hypothetical protein
MRVMFGLYEPDKPPFLASGLQVAGNVYRAAIGYRPVGQFAVVSDALAAEPVGAATFVNDTTTVVAGTTTALYRLNGTAWTSLHTGYTAGTRWSFAQFGSLAIATNGQANIQKIDLSTFATADLGGTPPNAELLTVVKDFLLAGVIGGVRNKVQWSGINDAESWEIGVNQCDYQILPTGGDVTGLLGGEVGIILQRNRVSRMTYVGDNLVFQFDEISNSIGCVSPNSVIQVGQMGFWLSDAGFMQWDGATISPIGQEVIDRTFANSYSASGWSSMSTAVDAKNNLVAWGMGDRIFIYNWTLRSWSVIDKACPFIFAGFSSAVDPLFYAFNADNELGTFSGGPMEATLGMGDLELAPGREARLMTIRPLTDALDGVSLTFLTKGRQGDDVTESYYETLEDNGEMAVRESGRYIRITQTILADTNWTYAEGLDIILAKGARH